MAVERVTHLIKRSAGVAAAPLTRNRGRRSRLAGICRALRLPLMGLMISVVVGCSSNKTQTISESYVQSVVNLNNALVLHVGDVSRLTSAASALQQADRIRRQRWPRLCRDQYDFDAQKN